MTKVRVLATVLVGLCLWVRPACGATTLRVNVSTDGAQTDGPASYGETISADGRYVAFHSQAGNLVDNDLNGSTRDVFIRYLDAAQPADRIEWYFLEEIFGTDDNGNSAMATCIVPIVAP